MKFAIRDDDTSYFTDPELLECVYGDIWADVPISLAVVPFHASTRSGGVPREFWEGDEEFPVAQNERLIQCLREGMDANRISILLHGYNHKNYPDGYEFQTGPNLDRRISEGCGELKRLLDCEIKTFVPPHNALSRQGLVAVDRAGLNVLGSFLSFSPRQRPWDRTTLQNYLRVWSYRRRTGRRRHDRMVYPFPLRYQRHAELGCHGLIPGATLDALLRGFDEAQRAGGDFCLATHYWEIDSALADVLRGVVGHARRAGASFVHADQLFDGSLS